MSLSAPEDAPWQVLADCPHCLTEAGVVEWMDPRHGAARFGLPSETRCRMCGWQQRMPPLPPDDETCPRCRATLQIEEERCARCGFQPALLPAVPPADLREISAAREALQRWAREEGEEDLSVFCLGSFGLPPEEVVDKLVRREPIATTFDVIAHLFPSSGLAAAHRSIEARPERSAAPETPRAPAAAPDTANSAARLLVSVMLADGMLRAVERSFIARFLDRERLPPLSSGDLRVWRPLEVEVPSDPELRKRILEAAVQLAYVDGQRDESEWRVIRAFAQRFSVEDADLERWNLRYLSKHVGCFGRLLAYLSGG